MSKTLTQYVHVVDADQRNVVLKPGDTVPGWAKDQVTNPKVFEADEADDAGGDEGPVPYSKLGKADLQAQVDARNADRDDDAKIAVGGQGHKPDLVKALEADDAAIAAAQG